MHIRRLAPLFVLLLISVTVQAQPSPRCGQDLIISHWIGQDPHRQAAFEAFQQEQQHLLSVPSTAKGTAQVKIPVVFQVILRQNELNSIGGEQGLRRRIATQIDALNRDFNAQNPDKSKVPAVFSSVFGNPEIQFAPAHRDPQGKATDGFVLKITNETGFAIEQSTERRSVYGGLDPWDPERYLNVWIVNISNSGVLGYALSPGYAQLLQLPRGVTLSYLAFGQKQSIMDGAYFASTDSGRTMVHEVGHFFNLNHIWGNTAVGQGNCQDDDGVADTPLQKDANYSCQIFPKPNCNNSPGGEMFMNYMDYVNDACMYMFTKGQVARMRQQLSPQGPSFQLTQHPELFSYPNSLETLDRESTWSAYPNPVQGIIRIQGEAMTSQEPLEWSLHNYLGQAIRSQKTHWPAQGPLEIDAQGLPAGHYFLKIRSKDKQEQIKLEIL